MRLWLWIRKRLILSREEIFLGGDGPEEATIAELQCHD
jgi:hypothetical protein